MAADEEIAGHELAGEDVNASPVLPPVTDPADTCDAYAEIEYAGRCVNLTAVYPDLTIRGDTCTAYAEVDYAGACADATALFPGLPAKSNIEEFDTSTGRLGCGTPLVFITSRCSGNLACQIEISDVTKLTWTRKLDDVSEAEVEIGLTGDSSQTCCQCLAVVEPWCHELHIWRDGDEVWVGPIQAIRYEREKVIIKARDSLAWLDVRIPANDIDFKTTLTGAITDNPLTATATTINSAGFASLPAVTASVPTVILSIDTLIIGQTEVVQVTSHTAGATSLTAIRGQQGTPALTHLLGATWKYGGLSGPESDLTIVANFIVRDAFAFDVAAGRTCEVANLYEVQTLENITFYKERFNQTSLEILRDLATTQLNFTTLGRTIVLNGDSLSLTALTLLNDEHIMGDIEVTKDGQLQGNRYYVHFETDAGIPALGQAAAFYCYSLIERITDSNGLQSSVDAEVLADAYVMAAAIAPRILEIPSGSRLSPDTPWTINQMVPGAKVSVAVTRLCLSLTQSFILTGITVEYSSGDGESVGIDLSPINSVAVL